MNVAACLGIVRAKYMCLVVRLSQHYITASRVLLVKTFASTSNCSLVRGCTVSNARSFDSLCPPIHAGLDMR